MITIQDFKQREVSIVWFGLLFVIAGVIHYLETPVSIFLQSVLLSLIFLLFQFIVLHLYFWIKERKISLLFDQKIGFGDIVFLLSPMVFFSFAHFVIFYLSSLLFALLFTLVIQKFKNNFGTIPLAGIQSSYFTIYFLSCIILKQSPFNELAFS